MFKLRRAVKTLTNAFREVDSMEFNFTEGPYFVRVAREIEERTEKDGKTGETRVEWYVLLKKGEEVLIEKTVTDRKAVIKMLVDAAKAIDL